MAEGPESELTLTENAQPALMAVSLAVLRVLEGEGGLDLPRHVAYVAGHSLGEYSALTAAGTFRIADTARLLKRRGLAMQRAVPVGEGAMAALLGLDIEQARAVAEAAAQGEVCAAANDNAPGQVVVSGHKTAVERAIALAGERGARRSILLPVSAPFHCALMAVSLAVIRVLEGEGGLDLPRHVAFVAGHSLGEYSALTAAGTFRIADTARLLKRRGLAMQRAVPVGEGAMAALLGLDIEQARAVAEAAAQGEVCAAANDNAPGQVVVSGNKAAVERAIALAAERGARRSILLPVSAPFHCALMAPAANEMAEALAGVTMAAPSVPLIANVTAAAVDDPETIRRLLVEQVTGLVRWRESVMALKTEGVDTVVEVGTGRVLAGLVKRIDRDLAASSVGTPAEIEAFLKTL
jgi:[acyl-carrier-protein] S-malonyltransferase